MITQDMVIAQGKPSEKGCYAAIDTVYKHLTNELEISSDKIIVWGRSLGTGPSCYLAEKHKFAGLILETLLLPYRTVTETPVLPWDRFRNIERAHNIQNKSLVIHGHEDEIVPFRHGKRVFNALPEPKQFLEFKMLATMIYQKLGEKSIVMELTIFSIKSLVIDFQASAR